MSPHEVLGISPGATLEEAKSAYRRLVKRWHPDICRESNAAEMFKRIQRAYEMVLNPPLVIPPMAPPPSHKWATIVWSFTYGSGDYSNTSNSTDNIFGW